MKKTRLRLAFASAPFVACVIATPQTFASTSSARTMDLSGMDAPLQISTLFLVGLFAALAIVGIVFALRARSTEKHTPARERAAASGHSHRPH